MDIEKLAQLSARFATELGRSAELKSHLQDHQRRSQKARQYLVTDRILQLSEAELRELYFDTDAFGFWKNKDWEFNHRVLSVSLDGLRQALYELITRGEQGLTAASFKEVLEVRGLGILLATEFLCYRFPDRYWTYSPNVTLPVFQGLGEDIKGGQPRGQKAQQYLYMALEEPFVQVRQALSAAGLAEVDNLLADLFLWWVKQQLAAVSLPEPIPDVDTVQIEQAMRDFDTRGRSQPEWDDWEKRRGDDQAIQWQGRHYPIREILNSATGVEGFSESQAIAYLAGHGIQVVSLRAAPSNTWIFQANPKVYDLETGLHRHRINDWQVTRYRDEIKAGDRILFWKAGANRGLYGLGVVESDLYENHNGDQVVDVTYRGALRQPVLYSALLKQRSLSHLLILRQFQGTNFRVTPDEWKDIEPMLGEVIPPDTDAIDAREDAGLDNGKPIDRAAEASARQVLERLIPDRALRRICAEFLAFYLEAAHTIEPNAWAVTLFPNRVRLNIGKVQAFVIAADSVYLLLDRQSLDQTERGRLKELGETALQRYDSLRGVFDIELVPAQLRAAGPIIQHAAPPIIERAARIRRTPYYRTHSPGVLAYLRSFLGREVPNPGYANGGTPPLPPEPLNIGRLLSRALAAQGLHYSDWQTATFYTALQTKPFVILSGISGTGKTKLAQCFAALLPQPVIESSVETDQAFPITVQPYMLKYGRLIVPQKALQLFDPPPAGQTRELPVHFRDQSQTCRLVHAAYDNHEYVSLLLRGTARQWFVQSAAAGDRLELEPEFGPDEALASLRLSLPDKSSGNVVKTQLGNNLLFVPVRPDWRDNKSLLGYYNPILSTYEWTPFLRFLLNAANSYRAGDGMAWFVILDEMNLAHVEYYFADLLSVGESGRDDDGWTREPLRFIYPDEAEGDLPPRKLCLPPNLYVIGTVNVDETTQAFSPKVLDRAFTLELTEADFSGYLTNLPNDSFLVETAERAALLDAFTQDGAFPHYGYGDKQPLVEYLSEHGDIRQYLQNLNNTLRPYNLHFGYRVFDEIVGFVNAADRNQLFEGLGGMPAAFDTAVLMKVLPKFHGSRARLEEPLKAVLGWCLDPVAPAEQAIDDALAQNEELDVREVLNKLSYQYGRTAERARRMLWELYTNGFAAFG